MKLEPHYPFIIGEDWGENLILTPEGGRDWRGLKQKGKQQWRSDDEDRGPYDIPPDFMEPR